MTFSVIAKSVYGCVDSASVSVTVNSMVYVPNAFTPNGDGKNDFYRPVFWGQGATLMSLNIYDRWGALVFTTTDNSSKGWDGNYDGSPAAIGTYFYQVAFKAYDGTTVKQVGDLSLIR